MSPNLAGLLELLLVLGVVVGLAVWDLARLRREQARDRRRAQKAAALVGSETAAKATGGEAPGAGADQPPSAG